jgi:hypothetical protein
VTDEQPTAKFLRGLTLGVIIGAVIAGSSFWTRRRRAANRPGTLPAEPAAKALDSVSREAPDTN